MEVLECRLHPVIRELVDEPWPVETSRRQADGTQTTHRAETTGIRPDRQVGR
jgi:hypothetical protein